MGELEIEAVDFRGSDASTYPDHTWMFVVDVTDDHDRERLRVRVTHGDAIVAGFAAEPSDHWVGRELATHAKRVLDTGARPISQIRRSWPSPVFLQAPVPA